MRATNCRQKCADEQFAVIVKNFSFHILYSGTKISLTGEEKLVYFCALTVPHSDVLSVLPEILKCTLIIAYLEELKMNEY